MANKKFNIDLSLWIEVYGFPKYEVNQLGQIRNKETKQIKKTTKAQEWLSHCFSSRW